MGLYKHTPHPHIAARKDQGPVRVADQHPTDSASARFNTRLGLRITQATGTMMCAYLFCLLALVSFPAAITSGSAIIIVSWVAQTFLQLVLLPVIIVGQNAQAAASDERSLQTFNDAEAVLHTAIAIEEHLQAQDAVLTGLAARGAPQEGSRSL